jgi:outer membrane protein assembly factor BamB
MKTTRKTLLVSPALVVLVLCTCVLAGPVRRLRPPRNPHSRYGPEYGCVKWQFQAGGPVTASVALSHNKRRVYIPCEDGKLYALDAKSGALLWSYDANSPLLGSPAVRPGGRVYVGASDGKLHAIGRRGRLLWTYPTDGAIYASPGLADGHVYACSLDGLVYALTQDGNDLWSFETDGFATIDGAIFATPQTGPDSTLYIAGVYDPNLYALSPADGSIIWARSFEAPLDPCDPNSPMMVGWPFAAPAVAPDGTIYQTLLYNANLYAVEPETGETIWSTDLAGTIVRLYDEQLNYTFSFIWFGPGEPPEYIGGYRVDSVLGKNHRGGSMSKPALARDGTIYVAFDDSYLRAVNPDGTVKWAACLGPVSWDALPGGYTLTVDDAGLIYAASDDKNLYVVDPDGNQIAQFEGDDWLSHPVIARDGTLLVSDANNTVWAISEQACDGEEPVLDGSDGQEPNEPIELKGKQRPKPKAKIRVRRSNPK